MSGRTEKLSHFPDEIDKQKFEDEKLFDPSGTDSGFISSGNLMISEELYDESEDQRDENTKENTDKNSSNDKKVTMIDDGVVCDISEDLSKMNLQLNNLNDLNSTKTQKVACDKKEKSENIEKSNASDITWKVHFQQDEDGDTHLHMAINHGIIDAVYNLIRLAPHPRLLDTPNDDALTPLHFAVSMHQWYVVRWLIIAGARPGPRNLAGDSPLHLAVRIGDIDCCKAILNPVESNEREKLQLSYPAQICQKFDIEQWNHNGETCIHIAAQQGHIDILRLLIRYGANINAREGRAGYAALHYAVERNDERMINFLLYDCKAVDLEQTTYGGNSALQLGFPIKENILEMLLQKGVPSPYSSEDEYTSESEDEVYYDHFPRFIPNMINASA